MAGFQHPNFSPLHHMEKALNSRNKEVQIAAEELWRKLA